MHRILAVVNQKGGVGKTTTAINLSAALALRGFPTLLVDVDPQANTTGGLGFARGTDRTTVYDVLLGDATAAEAILPTEVAGLSLLPGTKDMVGANVELVSVAGREYKLRDALETVRGRYTFIVLDCPPALDLLTLNALVCADQLLVPMQAEYFALEGISELMSTVDRVEKAFGKQLGLAGVLLTMYDDRTNLSQQVRAHLLEFFKDDLLKTTIPRNVRLAEAPSFGKPAVVYDPKSRGAEAYFDLATEICGREGAVPPGPPERKKLIVDDIPPPRQVHTAPPEDAGKPKARFWPFR